MLRAPQGAVSARELFGPEKSGSLHFLGMRASVGCPRRLALFAGTPIPQELPGINPQLVIVIETKLDRVFAYAFRRSRLYGRLVHRQSPRGKFPRLSRLLMSLSAGLVAQGARTGIAQEWKRIMRAVAVLPLDIQTRTGAQIDFHRFRVRRGSHEFSIAQRNPAFFQDAGDRWSCQACQKSIESNWKGVTEILAT
jgi:hypothetical protein